MTLPIPFIGFAFYALLIGRVRLPAYDWMIRACLMAAADMGAPS